MGQKLLLALPTLPAIMVPIPRPTPGRDFDDLRATAQDELWRTSHLCGWWSGLRLSKARDLRSEVSDIFPGFDLPDKRIVFLAVFVKSVVDHRGPLHTTVLRKALEDLPPSGPEVFPFRSQKGGGASTRSGITDRVVAMERRTGIARPMLRLRKGFGCRVEVHRGKGNTPILHSLKRHSSMPITLDYDARVDDALHDAINDRVK